MDIFTRILFYVLLLLLLLSAGLNIYQYNTCRPPVIETVVVRDTLVQQDTVIQFVTRRVAVEKPVPVVTDSINNVRTYRDTLRHEFGSIRREEVVAGELLRKDIAFDFELPVITNTVTINNTVNQVVRNRLLYMGGGIRSDAPRMAVPVVGATYIPAGHRYMFGFDYGFDNFISARVGFAIIR